DKFVINKVILPEIYNGYSQSIYNKKQVFIKHFGPTDDLQLEDIRQEKIKTALKKGLIPQEERLKYLEDNELWTSKDEDSLYEKRSYIDSLIQTKKILISPSQKRTHQTQIDEENENL